jgi:hypothetical protein
VSEIGRFVSSTVRVRWEGEVFTLLTIDDPFQNRLNTATSSATQPAKGQEAHGPH